MDGATIWKVSYHSGEMFALVEAATPDAAVEIAKAHRIARFRYSGKRPTKIVLDDIYTVSAPVESDFSWCSKMGVGLQIGKPPRKTRKGGTLSDRGLRAIRPPQGVERAPPAVAVAA